MSIYDHRPLPLRDLSTLGNGPWIWAKLNRSYPPERRCWYESMLLNFKSSTELTHKTIIDCEFSVCYPMISHPRRSSKLSYRHNPLGKVFTTEELLAIGQTCARHQVLILSDEVYERTHYTATFPRVSCVGSAAPNAFVNYTVTVGSVGKAFNATGWRVGYLIGPEHLIKHVHSAHILLCYTTAGPAQEAAAVGLREAETCGFWAINRRSMEDKIKRFCAVLDELDLPVSAVCSAVSSVWNGSNGMTVYQTTRRIFCVCPNSQNSTSARLCLSAFGDRTYTRF